MMTLQAEHEWLVEHHQDVERQAGSWIAVLGERIVAVAKTFEDAYRRAVKQHPGTIPLVTYVPKKDEELLIL